MFGLQGIVTDGVTSPTVVLEQERATCVPPMGALAGEPAGILQLHHYGVIGACVSWQGRWKPIYSYCVGFWTDRCHWCLYGCIAGCGGSNGCGAGGECGVKVCCCISEPFCMVTGLSPLFLFL